MVSTRDRLKQTKEKLVTPLTIYRKPNSKKNDDLEIGDSNDRLTTLEMTVSDLTSTIEELVEQLCLTNLAMGSASAKRRDRSKKKEAMEVDEDDDFAEAILKRIGYTSNINHGVLVEISKYRKDFLILDTLISYQDFPPDKALADLAIEDKRRQIVAVEKYLEDVLHSALTSP
ncbi:hypothetical protein GIB67_030723 [Kingdonia uniflora]|uniref:Uncharacterized protein n=1 Tax=Kingdonia uniflora TaxID=39325 RepID=A0A7J7L306_9MAGN|nr:hypothetical protein GIB67_030723 [Kingdonia uniflora]